MASRAQEVAATGLSSLTVPGHFRRQSKPIAWPNGARIALTYTVVLELLTDTAPGYDLMQVIYSIYGGRRGVWRLLDSLAGAGINASFFVNGFAAEKFPEALKAIVNAGHEIVAYGYASNLRLEGLPANSQREIIQRTSQAIADVVGQRPVGWASPDFRPGKETLEILVEEGYQWNGDFPNDDLPYTLELGGRKLVIVPYIREVDDKELYDLHRYPPSTWVEAFRDSFCTLYKEGETSPKMLNATLHCQYLGHSLGPSALEETIRYARGHDGVWFATRGEIVRWWLEKGYD